MDYSIRCSVCGGLGFDAKIKVLPANDYSTTCIGCNQPHYALPMIPIAVDTTIPIAIDTTIQYLSKSDSKKEKNDKYLFE